LTMISITVVDRFGRRAIAVADVEWQPFDMNTDMSDYRMFDVRRVEVTDEKYSYQWLNAGEYTGVKP
jgi:hypothetical protein